MTIKAQNVGLWPTLAMGKLNFLQSTQNQAAGWVEEWVEGQEMEEAAEGDGEYGEV
jgi:hypothetical protein